MPVDDYYRLQVALQCEGRVGRFLNQSFGLPGKDSYTFTWALYPILSSDYYDFINLVRKDYVPNYTIEGSGAFANYWLPTIWSKQKMADWLKDRAVKIVILGGPYGGGPWLGGYGHYTYKVPDDYNLTEYLKEIKKARDIIKEIDPGIKCLAPLETPLIDNKPGVIEPGFPDSVRMNAAGNPVLSHFGSEKVKQYIYDPILTNSWYKHLKMCIERALKEAEVDGIYFDCFTCGGYTYDRWDNRSVDMNLDNYTIKKKKAETTELTEDARVDLVKTALSYKKGNVVVVNGMGMTDKIRNLPIFHFSEAAKDSDYIASHLSTPIILGWTPGYSPLPDKPWQKEWKTDKNYFEDIKDKLKNGCLYYTYWAPGGVWGSNLTYPTILSHMFPITIEEIHSGWIKGIERIITLHSGTYTWGDKGDVKCYFYDEEGKECQGIFKKIEKGKVNSFEIEVPENGATVIEKKED